MLLVKISPETIASYSLLLIYALPFANISALAFCDFRTSITSRTLWGLMKFLYTTDPSLSLRTLAPFDVITYSRPSISAIFLGSENSALPVAITTCMPCSCALLKACLVLFENSPLSFSAVPSRSRPIILISIASPLHYSQIFCVIFSYLLHCCTNIMTWVNCDGIVPLADYISYAVFHFFLASAV